MIAAYDVDLRPLVERGVRDGPGGAIDRDGAADVEGRGSSVQ